MSDSSRLDELKRRVERDPASISFAGLAEEYRRLGRFEEAIDTCRAGLQRHPSYVSARVTLGRALVEIGEFDAATGELEQVLRVAPENLAAIRALADIHRRRGDIPEVFEHYDTAPAEREEEAAVPALVPLSRPVPVAVQSSSVSIDTEAAALAELQSFLAAIQRARRDVMFQAAR
jgi:tetratricopeptide (TPR) repeat protein